MDELEQQRIEERAARQAELDVLPAITVPEYEAEVKRWMLLVDPYILRVLLYHYVANKLPGDPIWLMLIGPSGGGKSEIVTMLNDVPDYYALSTLTPQTLVSGFPGKKEMSLLPKLDGKIMNVKDFTTIMNMQKDARFEVFAQLREAFDGALVKSFGNGKIVDWAGKVGFLGAVTEAYDLFSAQNAAMGERFITYRMITADRKETSRQSIKNVALQPEMRKAMKNAAYSVIKGIDMNQPIPEIEPATIERVIALADFACLARSSVIRDFGMKKEIIFVPSPEMPTRLAQQIMKLIRASYIVNRGTPPPEDILGILKIALDSIPKTNRLAMRVLTRRNHQTTAEIATELGYPSSTVLSFLQDITMKGLCLRQKGADTEEGGNADRWTLKQEFRDILTEYDKIEQEAAEMGAEQLQALAAEFGGELVQ